MIKHAHCNLVLRRKYAAQGQDPDSTSDPAFQHEYLHRKDRDHHLHTKARNVGYVPIAAVGGDVVDICRGRSLRNVESFE
jgi:hypothetical protein